jgi:hypothetical protein
MANWVKFKFGAYQNSFVNLEQAGIIRYNEVRDELEIEVAGGHLIVISRKKDPTPFQQITDFIKQATGHDLT